jgi:hypothetical protein
MHGRGEGKKIAAARLQHLSFAALTGWLPRRMSLISKHDSFPVKHAAAELSETNERIKKS